ncbi:tetratricopeptide repeat protein [Streptomyces sp. NBC_01803]|uniref:tetratricopeptide repeat protein n=1 Tax=Streptomyces sp. NBC_01803 TaxID=2975946 RepID=UPI002DDBC3B5|nr:tetratricopeptide repeat protein [Streptomyces sp. NBC_01803]WSA43708.1 tetratricopeptide repeat protein [Streptomyces sp. NBC_01803]
MTESLAMPLRAVPWQAQEVLQRLGVLPDGVWDLWDVAAVCGRYAEDAGRLLERLVEAGLVTESGELYAIPLGLRGHARAGAAMLALAEREVALRRWLDWLLMNASAAQHRLSPEADVFGLLREYRHVPPFEPRISNPWSATQWLVAHRAALVDAVFAAHAAGLAQVVWQLVDALEPLALSWAEPEVWAQIHDLAVEAAGACGQQRAARVLLVRRGTGLAAADRPPVNHAPGCRDREGHGPLLGPMAGLEDLHEALDQARAAWDVPVQAAALRGLGLAYRQAGDTGEAVRFLRRALELWERDPDQPGAREAKVWEWEGARIRADLGVTLLAAGAAAEALEALGPACRAFEAAGDLRGEATGLVAMAFALAWTDHRELADKALARAKRRFSELGDAAAYTRCASLGTELRVVPGNDAAARAWLRLLPAATRAL